MRRASLLAAAALGCGDADGHASSATDTASDSTDTMTTASDATTDTTVSTASSASETPTASAPETGTSGAPAILCDALDVSLVIDPAAPVLDSASRSALTEHLDELVTATGAEVRVHVNVGTEQTLVNSCLWGLPPDAADGPVLTWGRDFAVTPDAHDALDCSLDVVRDYQGVDDAGEFLFSGLMFPIAFDVPQWPTPGSVSLGELLASSDDGLGGMYSRPGMTSEAFIRLAGAGDRQFVASFAMGVDADELETFTLSLGDTSSYADFTTSSLADALADWTPLAVQACDDHDYSPDPPPPKGCEHLDVLFVVDGSVSMDEEQAALRGVGGMDPVFKDFTDALLTELDSLVDFHVGVVSAEPGDTVLHTHTDQPEVMASPATACGLPPNRNWLVGPSASFEEDFACIASTRANPDEVTAYNAAEALHDPANAGFLRDDSILLVVMLTDEETWDSNLATRVEIRERILDAVDGDLERVIVLAIAGGQGTFEMPTTVCQGTYGSAVPARRLLDIVRSFQHHGLDQDICEGDLARAFAETLGAVITACENYGPEG